MLYSEIKQAVLGHINQYSIAGAQIAPSYNNQSDYLLRIPQLINEGLVNIRTLVKPLPVVLDVAYTGFVEDGGSENEDAMSGTVFGEDSSSQAAMSASAASASTGVTRLEAQEYHGEYRAKLPRDFWCMKTGGVERIGGNGRLRKTNYYRLQGKDFILFPDTQTCTIEYYRYPDQLPLDPDDDFELAEDPEVLHAAIYYAAANLVLYDDQFAYANLYNDYESRLARISPGTAVEVHPVDDAYGFFGGY